MAHQEIDAAGRPMAPHRAFKRRQRFEAEPAHAGVEMEREGRDMAAARHIARPAPKLVLAANRGP